MVQDYDKDLFIVLVGTGKTTHKNFVDNVEDYIFGDRDEREVTLLVPYTKDMSPSLGDILNEWAVGSGDAPNYPILAFVENDNGHRSIAVASDAYQFTDADRVTMESAAIEAAMQRLVEFQKEGNEVAVVVLYDEENDVRLIGELKNYPSIPVLNVNGMIDSFPGFKTTDEILEEERKREEFETKEAIRIAAEKEQEKATKPTPTKKAAAPRKRAASKPVEDKPLTETTPRKAAAPRKKVVPPKPEPVEEKPDYKVGASAVVGGIPFVKHSEWPKDLEPVKVLPKPVETPLPTPVETPLTDVWTEVAKAKSEVNTTKVTHYAVSKENLASLSEGITEMAQSFSKVMASMTRIIEGE